MIDSTDDLLGAETADLDGDGTDDMVIEYFEDGSSVAAYDFDGDGRIDAADLDADGDGTIDMAVVVSGDSDEVRIMTDPSSDGGTDETISLDEAEDLAPGLVGLLGQDSDDVDFATGDASPENPFVADPGGSDDDGATLVGDPFEDADLWFEQAVNGTCAPATVAQIVAAYTGTVFTDEQDFVDMALEAGTIEALPDGTYTGMYAPDIADLLTDAGIPAGLEEGLTVDDLSGLLADGVGVAVMVDADEYWNPMYGMPEEAEDWTPNHIVLVTGVDQDAGVIYVNDTGTPDGEAMEVPIAYFEDAWDDSNFQAIVCDEPAPGSGTFDVDNDDDRRDDDRGDTDRGRDGRNSGRSGSALPTSDSVARLISGPWALLPVVLEGSAVAAARA